MKVRFRSKNFREIYLEAIDQGFEGGRQQGSGHYYLRCPKKGCGYTHTFSASVSDSHAEKVHNFVTSMRRHGFVWEGRGGEHTAPRLHRTLRRERKAS